MNQVAASRLKMMLAAGKHRLEVKEAKAVDRRQLARAERVLARYEEQHGPLTYSTPESVLNLARLVAHHRTMLTSPGYAYWFKTGSVHTDHLPAPEPEPKKKKFDYTEYKTRQLEARAADPEKFAREKAADRRRRNQFWFNYTETSQFDKANEALREDRLDHLPARRGRFDGRCAPTVPNRRHLDGSSERRPGGQDQPASHAAGGSNL